MQDTLLEHVNQHFHSEFMKKETYSVSMPTIHLTVYVAIKRKENVNSLQDGELFMINDKNLKDRG